MGASKIAGATQAEQNRLLQVAKQVNEETPLTDLYQLIEGEYQGFDDTRRQLFTAELLQEILLGLHSMCRGAEAPFFDGHTNITDNHFIVFGVKGLLLSLIHI